MKYKEILVKNGIGLSDLSKNIQDAAANLQHIINEWSDMPEGTDKNLVRDMIVKVDDYLCALITNQSSKTRSEKTNFIARLLHFEARYLAI